MWLTAIAGLALLLAGRTVCLALKLADGSMVESSTCGAVKLELRRRVAVFKPEGDSQAFPQPREVRMLVLRLGGIPVFCREESIGLPKEMDARLDQVSAKDFDAHFSDAFRIAPRRSISTTRALQMLRRG